MKLLLDTHILLWTLTNSPDLPALARKLIGDNSNSIFFSSLSAWEVELKHEKHPQQMTIGGKEMADYAISTGFYHVGLGLNEINCRSYRILTRKKRFILSSAAGLS